METLSTDPDGHIQLLFVREEDTDCFLLLCGHDVCICDLGLRV